MSWFYESTKFYNLYRKKIKLEISISFIDGYFKNMININDLNETAKI